MDNEWTYKRNLRGWHGKYEVIIPDQIAEDQHHHDEQKTAFWAIYPATGGGKVKVRLDGEAYGLWTPGTGDMRVVDIEDEQ